MANRNCIVSNITDNIITNMIGVGRNSATQLKVLEILLPIGGINGTNEKLATKDNTYQWAKSIQKQVNIVYNSKLYGNLIDINNSRIDGTIVNIRIPSKLIDAYEKQEDDKNRIFYLLDDNKVNYQLKAIKALESDKVRQPKTSIIQGFYNDLVKQGIPKDQLDIIKDTYKDGMAKEELISSLLADISYTVEINVTKENNSFGSSLEKPFIINNDNYNIYWGEDSYGNPTAKYLKNGISISETEYDKAYMSEYGSTPTQHYANLTVPGGTNYTENEIKTPNIEPNIKGHAQFSTNNGIGWFRSDEQTIEGQPIKIRQLNEEDFDSNYKQSFDKDGIITLYKEENETLTELGKFNNKEDLKKFLQGKLTKVKTRRILEVQSDLFQKGRNEPFLYEEFGEETVLGTVMKDSNKNKFLQLLNKDSNWVTFFVKSIIQDSAKKQYEKVLFPLGDTASKIEGHTTLEEFKKDKLKEIEKFEKLKQEVKNQTPEEYPKADHTIQSVYKGFHLNYNSIKEAEESYDRPINQYKEELKRVETEGFGALRPIHKFYEETIGNILKKQGYNPTVITDEYNNQWYEVTINQSRDISNIYLQLKGNSTVSKKNNLIEQSYILLKEYTKQNGIKIEFLDSLKHDINDPIAIYNSFNKVIQINQNKASNDTLPEELAHHLTNALGNDNILVKRALNLISRLNYRSELGDEYIQAYKDDSNMLKHEYLGKLIAKSIVNKLEKPKNDTEIKLWDTIKNIINKFISLFKPNNNITSQLDKVTTELAEILIVGNKIEDNNSLNNTFYSLNKKVSSIHKKELKQEVYFKRLLKELRKQNKVLQYKLSNNNLDTSIIAKIKSNEEKIQNINASLSEYLETNNKQLLVNLANDILDNIEQYINKLESLDLDNISTDKIEHTVNTLNIFKELAGTSDRSKQLYNRLKPFISNYALNITQEATNNPDLTEEDINYNSKDIFVGDKNFGTLSDVKSYLGRSIGYLIKKAQDNISRENKASYESLNKHLEVLKKYNTKNNIPKDKMYDIFIQEYNNSTILTKPYTSNFYNEINKSFNNMEFSEGQSYRKSIANFNFETKEWEPKDKSKYNNKNYIKIQSTPELKQFYNYFKKTIKDISEELPVNLNSNFIPNITEKSLLDIIKSDKTIGKKLKEGIQNITDIYPINEDPDSFINNENLLTDDIPLKYIGKLNPEDKSSDLGSSLLKFMYFGNSYKEMSEVLPKTRLLQEEIENREFVKNTNNNIKISGETSNIFKMADNFIEMQVKGNIKKEEILGKLQYGKIIDFGLKYTSLLRIGLNPFNAITNVLIGNIGNIIESIGGRYYNYSNYLKAREIFFTQNLDDNSKVNNLIRIFNPLMELEDYENLDKVNIGSNEYRDKIKSIMYWPQKVGEKYLQTSTMIANLLHDKVTTKEGKEISIWEAFKDNGEWNSELMGYELDKDEIFRRTNKIQRINQMIHGRYSAKDAATLTQYSLFRAVFQFRKWIPAAIESRFQTRRIDDRLDYEVEGRYRTWIKQIQSWKARLTGDIEKLKKYKFDETDLYNMRKNYTELTIVLATILMYIGLGGLGDDDKELKQNGWYKLSMNQLDRVSGDLLFFYNPTDVGKTINQGLPMIKTLTDLSKVITNLPYAFGITNVKHIAPSKTTEYTKGKNKDINREVASLIDIVPGMKPLKDVVESFNKEPFKEIQKK